MCIGLGRQGPSFGSGFGLGWGFAGSPSDAWLREAALLAGAAAIVKKSILTNEAGMFFDIKRFCFWNSRKAGMLMKTRCLFP